MAEENNPTKILWWALGIFIYIGATAVTFYILNFTYIFWLIFYGSSLLLLVIVLVIIHLVKKSKKEPEQESQIPNIEKFEEIAREYALQKAHVAVGETIYEDGISYESEEKIPVYSIWFSASQSANTYAVCINVRDTNVKKFIKNPNAEAVERLKQSVAGTKHEIAVTTESYIDPLSGREVRKTREEPLYLLPKKEEKKEENPLELK